MAWNAEISVVNGWDFLGVKGVREVGEFPPSLIFRTFRGAYLSATIVRDDCDRHIE